ncbi:MAG: OmpA family protein [Hyphomicrobium sp.]
MKNLCARTSGTARSVVGSCGVHVGKAAAVSISILVGLLSIEASAGERYEVPLGTFLIEGSDTDSGPASPGDPSRGVDGYDAATGIQPRQWFLQTPFDSGLDQSQKARQALLEDAQSELSAGRASAAQRLFEQLIASAPDTEEAKTARSHLADLYKRGAGTGAAGTPGVAADLPWSRSNRGIGEDQAVARPRAAVRVSRATEDQFISESGDRVFFGAGSAELGTRARSVLKAQARFLLRRSELGIIVEGHTDDGAISPDENERLALERAEAVRARLIAEGVEERRIAVVARGRGDRVSVCTGPECLAQNRRAVVVLMSGTAGLQAAVATATSTAPRETGSTPSTQ